MDKNNALIQDDEIDLYELYCVIKSHIKFIICFVFGLTLLTIILTFFMKPVYKSDMVVRIPEITNANKVVISYPEIKSIIDEISLLYKEKRYDEIAKRFDVSVDTVLAVNNLEIKDDKTNKNIFYLTLYVYDKNKIPQLTDTILKYINQNPVVKTTVESRLNELDTYINDVQTNIVKFEALKNTIFKAINNGQVSLLGFNPVDINISLINLKSQVETLKGQKDLLQKGVSLFSQPYIPKYKYKPKRSLIAAVSFISSIFIAIFIVFFKEWVDTRKGI